jgi:hypothetical protein
MVVLHDGQGRGGDSDGLVVLSRLEEHRLTRAELDDLGAVPTDPELPADHHEQLGTSRRVPSDPPARLQDSSDHVRRACTPQQRWVDVAARRIDRVVDRDTPGTEGIELGSHDLDDLHPARLNTAPR